MRGARRLYHPRNRLECRSTASHRDQRDNRSLAKLDNIVGHERSLVLLGQKAHSQLQSARLHFELTCDAVLAQQDVHATFTHV